MSTLYLIRLAETENNIKKVWSGRRIDSPLTPIGIWQSFRVADLLRNSNIFSIFSSPMLRVIETAKPLADTFGKEMNLAPFGRTF